MSTQEEIRTQISSLVEKYAEIEYQKANFIAGETAIPVSGKVLDHQELGLMVEASLDGWLTAGRFNEDFEKKLANFLGVKYLLTTNSGSSANLLAFSALTSSRLKERAIKPGDEVIGVAAGFPTTVNPIIQFGAIPVFVDIETKTHNIDVSKIEAAISTKTKAIMLAHSLGNPFNLKVVIDICRKYNLWLIEDNCDALGSKYNNQLTGTFGDIGTLSFYPAHHITMGEGGAVFTNNAKLKPIIESFRDWGRDCYCPGGKDNTCGKRFGWQLGTLPEGYDHKYTYSHAGYNLKITDMQAACGVAQLEKLNDFIQARKDNFKYLYEKLKTCENFISLPVATENSDPSWFGFLVTIKEEAQISRVDFLKFLDQNKIGTRLLFAGNIVRQPYMADKKYRISEDLTHTDYVMNNSFWVGVYPGLTHEMLDFIVDRFETYFGLNF
jgi:CDP-4-dehydro-6-deoxyglucose reductase, E1